MATSPAPLNVRVKIALDRTSDGSERSSALLSTDPAGAIVSAPETNEKVVLNVPASVVPDSDVLTFVKSPGKHTAGSAGSHAELTPESFSTVKTGPRPANGSFAI